MRMALRFAAGALLLAAAVSQSGRALGNRPAPPAAGAGGAAATDLAMTLRALAPEELRAIVLREEEAKRQLERARTSLILGIFLGILAAAAATWSFRKTLFVEKKRAQVTLDSIGDAVICTDTRGNISFLNLIAEKLTGWTHAEASGLPMTEIVRIVDSRSREAIPDLIQAGIRRKAGASPPLNWLLVRRDGTEIPIEDSIAAIHDRAGKTIGAVIVFRDVTASRERASQISHSAHHDPLTGLPNRILLNDRILEAIALAPRHVKKVAVLFVDLDGFKYINDSLGHAIGDRLLQSAAARLAHCVRSSDTVSRVGGDEFVVLLSEVEGSEDAAVIATKILHAFSKPHTVDHQELHVTMSIGVSVYPYDGRDADTLIKNADTAMYQAKGQGRQRYQFFTPAMNVQALERQFLEDGIRLALLRREFALVYQPKVDLRTREITGAEALIRWKHPVRGPIPPARFIPVAEHCGLITPIGKWVLREACKQARTWVDAGLPSIMMAVNVSAIEFMDEDFLESVLKTLADSGLDPHSLELELTESVLMRDAGYAEGTLKALRRRGVRLALDDFGTGYSSLSYLKKFKFDTLKIDQAFVRQITTTPEEVLVSAVIDIGRSLKQRVVAEGVEAREEVAFLEAHQCHEAQGNYFSHPLPPGQFAQLLATGVPKAAIAYPSESGGMTTFADGMTHVVERRMNTGDRRKAGGARLKAVARG